MLRFLWWLCALPVGIVVVALAVANRRPVALALDPVAADPFAPGAALPAVVLPGYLLVLGTLILGILVGGIVMWWSQGHHRRASRRWRERARALERDLAARDALANEAEARGSGVARLPAGERRVA